MKIKAILSAGLIALLIVSSFTLGNIYKEDNSYAASAYDNLSAFKAEGDYLEISTDTVGKASLAAQLPERSHVAAVGGIYNIQIWTPKGEDGYTTDKNGNKNQVFSGSVGQYLTVDAKIAKGSKLTTIGNLAEGVGIRGIVQLAAGNGGGNAGATASRYSNYVGRGYFGGNGGTGYRGGNSSPGGTGGTGYCGGTGGNGANGTDPSVTSGGTGGDGYIPGLGGYWKGDTSTPRCPSGNTYPMNYPSPINQVREGTVKSRTGGAFPSFTTSDYNGTDARIRITLKTITPVGPNDGIVSIEVNESASWEAMMQIGNAMDRIATAMENGSGSGGGSTPPVSPPTPNVDIATVIAGKSFSEYVNVSDDNTVGGSLNGIQVINNNNKDGVVQITGNIANVGTSQVSIGGLVYTLKAIQEPDSTNIKAMLN